MAWSGTVRLSVSFYKINLITIGTNAELMQTVPSVTDVITRVSARSIVIDDNHYLWGAVDQQVSS